MIQEHSMMKSGIEELISTAFTAVVLRRPRYTRLWNATMPVSERRISIPTCRRINAALPRSAGSANGASATAAISQRQKLSVTGSNASRSARPAIQLPDHNRLASASSANAESLTS